MLLVTLPPADISRLLKKSFFSPARPRRAETRLLPCVVLASFPGTVKLETRGQPRGRALPADKARPQGIEAVLADSGWAGEVAARVGLVRNLAFLNSLQRHSPTSQYVPVFKFKKA
jgi:hypothetical protein